MIIIVGIFKYILGIISVVGTPETDGWFPVEKVPKAEEMVTDVDRSIWVLFSKRMGSEQFSVRLPEDPVYRATDEGFILRSVRGGEIFEVSVLKNFGGPFESDVFYEHEGKWIHEHLVHTEKHVYRLRTYSPTAESAGHSKMISSFSIL